MAHLLAVPLSAAPTSAFSVDDAGTAAAAAWVFVHVQLQGVASLLSAAVLISLHERPYGGEAAIHGNHLTGEACRAVTEQPGHHVGHLFGRLHAAQRVLPRGALAHGRQLHHAGRHGRIGQARSYGVDAQALCGIGGRGAWIDEEAQMDAVTGVSGSGPAYFFLLIEALEDAGVEQGLPRDTARQLAIQTCLGAARMASEDGEAPARLRERVTSPNGTTAAALKVLGEGDLRGLMARAVAAATQRGGEMSKELG